MTATQRHNWEEFEPENASFYDENFVEADDEGEEIGQVASDQEIEDVVKELIHNSRRLDGNDISVAVDHADITLKGSVRTEDEKYIAGSLAQLIHGVGLIRNELIVKRNAGILPTDIGRHD
jgi:osmotically-inducible protein OsmY